MKRFAFVLFIVFVTTVFGQFHSLNVELIGRALGGYCYSLSKVDNYLYVGSGGRFSVYDVTEPDATVEVGFCYISGVIYDICIQDDLAYIVNLDYGFHIIDISEPTTPIELSFTPIDYKCYDIDIVDEQVFLTCDRGMFIINVADPRCPEMTSYFPTSVLCNNVHVHDNYAFLANDSAGVRIVDISDVSEPDGVTIIDPSWANSRDIFANDSLLYVSLGPDGLKIYNICDITDPIEVCHIREVGSYFSNFQVVDSILYITNGSRLKIYNIQDLDEPVVIDEYAISAHSAIVEGNYTYSASLRGFQILDRTDRSSPEIVYEEESGGNSDKLIIKDNFVYVVSNNYSGVRIVDVSDPLNSFETGKCMFGSQIKDIGVNNEYVYLLSSNNIGIINVTNSYAPFYTATYTSDYTFENICIFNNFAFVSGYLEGTSGFFDTELFQYDISLPTSPEEFFTYNRGSIPKVAVSGGYLFTGYYEDLLIYAYSEHHHSYSYDIGSSIYEIQIVEPYAYVITSTGLNILDISDISDIRIISNLDVGSYASNIVVRDNFVFLTIYDGWLKVVDVSNPIAPVITGYYETADHALGLCMYENYAIVSDNRDGLYILDVSEATKKDYAIPVYEGWNLLTFPFTDYTITDLLPESIIAPFFTFNTEEQIYIEEDSINSGTGFFLVSENDTLINIPERNVEYQVIDTLFSGWNLIGGPFANIPVDVILSEVDVIPPIYGYNPATSSYFEADTIRSLQGYWILYNGEEPSEITIP